MAASGKLHKSGLLGRTASTTTTVSLFRELEVNDRGVVTCKIGRYKSRRGVVDWRDPEHLKPMSVVTLKDKEFARLLEFLELNAELLLSTTRRYIEVTSTDQAEALLTFREFLACGDHEEILRSIADAGLSRADLSNAIRTRERVQELKQFDEMLEEEEDEHAWQKWFQRNPWVLGSEYVAVLEDRKIDTENTSDYLVQAADTHLDLIEIKRPSLIFWHSKKDHDNLVPHSDLVKALTQAQNYLYQLEREMNSLKATERYGLPIAKPRALLIFGRSHDWTTYEFHAQRLLNGGLSNVQVLTYDQVRAKAERILTLTNCPGETDSQNLDSQR